MKSTCLHCSIIFDYKPGVSEGKFCSNQCQAYERNARLVKEWMDGTLDPLNAGGQLRRFIKEWVKDRDRRRCVICGWDKKNPISGKSPLEVDHINGDHMNSRHDNLRTLCPNCHSLTGTWKNTGNKRSNPRGRKYRRKTET